MKSIELPLLVCTISVGLCGVSAADTNMIVWGSGGVTSVPDFPTNAIAVAGGDTHGIALLADRTVRTWGAFAYGGGTITPPAGLTNVVGIASGSGHALALRSDGSVALWGIIIGNTTTQVAPDATNVVALGVGPGAQHALVLRADGTVVDWGLAATTNVPPEAFNIVSVAAGANHSLALRSDGRVIAWGSNSYGQTNVPASATNIVAVATTWHGNIAVRADGRILTWGLAPNIPNQSQLTNIVETASAGGFGGGGMTLTRDGRVIATGAPVTATNCMAIGGSGSAYMAVKATGSPAFPFPAVRRTVAAGQVAYLRHRPVGALPMSYQWSFYGTNLPSATNQIFVVTNVQTSKSGPYVLTVSNAFGVTTSEEISLNVEPLEVTLSPKMQTVIAGSNVTFTAVTVGQGPFTYQWRFEGTDLPGMTNTALVLTNLNPSQAGKYSVAVTNLLGGMISPSSTLTVVPLRITSQPQNQTVLAGTNVTLAVSVVGIPPFNYQWRFESMDLPGATNSSLSLTNVDLVEAGKYSVTVSNSFGGVRSQNATLVVNPLTIVSQLQNQTVLAGTNVSFSVNVDGMPPFSYQWRMGGLDLPGATNSALVISNVHPSQTGNYSVTVSNGYGGSVSSNASLNVLPLSIAVNPSNVLALLWSPAAFSVRVAGQGPFSYQWRFNGTNLAGATGDSLMLANVQLSQGGSYSVAISNIYGSTSSAPAVLSLRQVAVWGDTGSRQAQFSVGLTNVKAIAAGYYHTLALRENGTVSAWGSSFDQTNVPPNVTNVIVIAAGGFHNLAIKADGTLVAWGSGFYNSTATPAGLSNIVAIAGGEFHSMALRADGTVVAWGAGATNSGVWPDLGQAIVPTGLSNVVAISAKGTYSLALKSDGTLTAWGANDFGQTNVPVGLTNVIGIGAGYRHGVALRVDGTIATWGANDYSQTNVPVGLTNMTAVVAGTWNSLALTADNQVVAWGRNDYGQTNVPVELVNVKMIAGGNFHLAALLIEESPSPTVGLATASVKGGNINVSLATQSGRVYRLEHKDDLSSDDWVPHPLVAGTGGVVTLADLAATASQRFYRVRRW